MAESIYGQAQEQNLDKKIFLYVYFYLLQSIFLDGQCQFVQQSQCKSCSYRTFLNVTHDHHNTDDDSNQTKHFCCINNTCTRRKKMMWTIPALHSSMHNIFHDISRTKFGQMYHDGTTQTSWQSNFACPTLQKKIKFGGLCKHVKSPTEKPVIHCWTISY